MRLSKPQNKFCTKIKFVLSFADLRFIQSNRETLYTETKWLNTDPKRIVLAQFTWPTETEKASVLEKAHEWVHKVGQVFHHAQQQNTLYILGLFALNRFSVADFVSSTLI